MKPELMKVVFVFVNWIDEKNGA